VRSLGLFLRFLSSMLIAATPDIPTMEENGPSFGAARNSGIFMPAPSAAPPTAA
jgi:hypothetical protein